MGRRQRARVKCPIFGDTAWGCGQLAQEAERAQYADAWRAPGGIAATATVSSASNG